MFSFIKNLFSSKKDNQTSQNLDTSSDIMNTFLIVGLGNIGNEYALTRHNIGFLVLDRLAAAKDASWTTERLGDIAEFKIKNRTFILLKPSTYMNLSGKAVKYWLEKRKIEVENLFIVVDELSLPFGALRIKGNGSDGGHNGLKSLNEVLQTQKYPRLRVGIGNEFQKGKQVDYVLGTWTEEEMADLPTILDACGDAIRCFAMAGMTDAMNKFNKKNILASPENPTPKPPKPSSDKGNEV